MTVLVTGTTGKFASLIVRALASYGIQVRAVVHDTGKSAVPLGHGASQVVAADLANLRATLGRARCPA
jgi:uncharacterized protein YbjT (DUF2867 family)